MEEWEKLREEIDAFKQTEHYDELNKVYLKCLEDTGIALNWDHYSVEDLTDQIIHSVAISESSLKKLTNPEERYAVASDWAIKRPPVSIPHADDPTPSEEEELNTKLELVRQTEEYKQLRHLFLQFMDKNGLIKYTNWNFHMLDILSDDFRSYLIASGVSDSIFARDYDLCFYVAQDWVINANKNDE